MQFRQVSGFSGINITYYQRSNSLIATNARRMREAVGPDKSLLEFGLRRAQGPDGAMSASRYAHMGGFNGTSNVLAGKEFSIPISGTHAHSFVTSFVGFEDLKTRAITATVDGETKVRTQRCATHSPIHFLVHAMSIFVSRPTHPALVPPCPPAAACTPLSQAQR